MLTHLFDLGHPLYGAITLLDRWWSLLEGSHDTWATVDGAMVVPWPSWLIYCGRTCFASFGGLPT